MSQRWDSTRSILCVRLDSIGDVLMCTPAIRAVRYGGHGPERRITLLTSSAGAEAGRLVPLLDDVIAYDAPWLKATPERTDSGNEYEMAALLKQRNIDAAVIFTTYSQSPLPAAFLCYLAGIPLRLAHCRENPYQLLTDWLPEQEPAHLLRHEVQRQLDLVAAAGFSTNDTSLSLTIHQGDLSRTRRWLGEYGLDLEHPWVIIHPGASAPSRRYPWRCYAEVARRLIDGAGWQVLLVAGPSEHELLESIRNSVSSPRMFLMEPERLADLAAVIALAPVIICNNSGPAHLAAAARTPVVDVYALTNPQHSPWQVPCRVLSHDVPCKNCYRSVCPEGHQNCLRLVTPAEVVSAALALFQETHAVQPAVERAL